MAANVIVIPPTQATINEAMLEAMTIGFAGVS